MNILFGKSRSRKVENHPKERSEKRSHSDEPMVIRHQQADGSVRYEVTDALLRRAAKAASRKNLEAA
jgi:hypothetical protein